MLCLIPLICSGSGQCLCEFLEDGWVAAARSRALHFVCCLHRPASELPDRCKGWSNRDPNWYWAEILAGFFSQTTQCHPMISSDIQWVSLWFICYHFSWGNKIRIRTSTRERLSRATPEWLRALFPKDATSWRSSGEFWLPRISHVSCVL